MRTSMTLPVACLLALAPGTAIAQTLASDSGAAQTAAAPAPQGAPATTTPIAGFDTARSLFDEAPNQFNFGGRFSSVNGDPARWQRYQDFRSGVLFTDARFTRNDPTGQWLFKATADNVGYYD